MLIVSILIFFSPLYLYGFNDEERVTQQSFVAQVNAPVFVPKEEIQRNRGLVRTDGTKGDIYQLEDNDDETDRDDLKDRAQVKRRRMGG